MTLTNETVAGHSFLASMYSDNYYPKELVGRVEAVLRHWCAEIERTAPADLTELYALSIVPTEQINELQEAFWDQDSELETVAREAMAEDFGFIADAYGFADVDIEELIAHRDW